MQSLSETTSLKGYRDEDCRDYSTLGSVLPLQEEADVAFWDLFCTLGMTSSLKVSKDGAEQRRCESREVMGSGDVPWHIGSSMYSMFVLQSIQDISDIQPW
jgi:hypothetical protein